jgi:phospholipase C
MPALDQIDTIAIVMMENRSFDHVLGHLSHEAFGKRGDIDGLHIHSDDFDWDNSDDDGKLYAPTATPDGYLPSDLPHSRQEVATELDSGSMLGFIKAYFRMQPQDRTPVPMRFCRTADVPVTSALANAYTVCDRWHASLPDDTFPNRLMSLSGYTDIDSTSVVKPPMDLLPDQTTIFDWLAGQNVTYGIYVDAEPIANMGPPSNLFLMKSLWKHVIGHGHTLKTLDAEWLSSAPAPRFMYIEPFFNDFATALGMHGNCNHPPLPIAYGEDFLRRVYTTLTANPDKWKRTMLVICYDEHGGLFDHVVPPAMYYAPGPTNRWLTKIPFETLGVRIPGVVVSPLVEPRAVCNALFDHTSIQQLLVEKFGKPTDLSYFGQAEYRRQQGVQSLSVALTRSSPRSDMPNVPDAPRPSFPYAITPPVSTIGQLFRKIIGMKPNPGA